MNYETNEHRYADIILNSDYELKKEIFDVIQSIDTTEVERRFNTENSLRKQSTINFNMYRAYACEELNS